MDTREIIKQKLKSKIKNKENERTGKKNISMEKVKSDNLYEIVKTLMDDVAFLKNKMGNKFNYVKIGKLLREKYTFLYDNYFPIYRATVFEQMSLEMLALFLHEKQKIATKEITQDDADKNIGNMLNKKYNVDVEKIEKDLKKKYNI